MGRPSTCMWIVVVTLAAGCVSERRDVADAPLGVVEGAGEGGGHGDDEGAGGDGGGDDTEGDDQACDDGDVQECTVDVGVQNGKKTCFAGSQRCRDGRWGPCHYVPGQSNAQGNGQGDDEG